MVDWGMGTDNAPQPQIYIDCNGIARADNRTGIRFNPGEKVTFLLAGGKYEEVEAAVQHAERTLVQWRTRGTPLGAAADRGVAEGREERAEGGRPRVSSGICGGSACNA